VNIYIAHYYFEEISSALKMPADFMSLHYLAK